MENVNMKKILYDLQLSVIDKEGKFIFETDSNCNAADFTIRGLLDKNPDWEFYLLIPPSDMIVNRGEFFKDSRIHLLEYAYFNNPFVDRMSLNAQSLAKTLEGIHIDMVYTNDPQKVLPYKTFFYWKQNEFVKIITRCHWVTGKIHRKVPEEIDFVIRQTEGVLYSEYATFNSNAAIEMFLVNAIEHFNGNVIEKLRDKCIAIETVDVEKVDKYKVDEGHKIVRFLFAHRLSFYTGWEEVLSVLDEIHGKGYKFELYMPDPGNKKDQHELAAKHPYLVPIDKKGWTHEDYLELCWKCDVAIGNHNIPTSWGGLALTEPMSAFCAPAMPNKDGYKEMFFQEDVFFNNRDEMRELLMRYILDSSFLGREKLLARVFCDQKLSMEKYISKINDIVKSCIS
jgi:hypothetical protein